MKSEIAIPSGIHLSDSSYPVRVGRQWRGCLLACSDPRFRDMSLKGLADELGWESGEIAPLNDFGGPSLLLYAEETVVQHILDHIKMSIEHGVEDVFVVQHSNACKGLAARGITFSNAQEEFGALIGLTRIAVDKIKAYIPSARVWGAVLLVADHGRRFKFAWIDSVPDGVLLEEC